MGVSLYTAEQVKRLDQLAINDFDIDGYSLMVQAGEAAFSSLISRWPNVRQLIVLCGGGNNGGDGMVIARLAVQHEIEVQLVLTADVTELSGEALKAANDALANDLTIMSADQIEWPSKAEQAETVIVDALLGTGLRSKVTEPYAGLILKANNSGVPILSIDVPSGLNATSGLALGGVMKADATITMIAYKQGLFTGHGPVVSGEISLAQLSLPQPVRETELVSSTLESWKELQRLERFQARPLDCHKGHFGHVMIVGGDLGCGGAISLAAGAALKSGAGLVSVATRKENVAAVLARYPEAMVHGVSSGQDLQNLLDRANAIVIGPGLGQSYWGEQLLQQVMAVHTPVLLDADALNILAKGRIKHNLAERISVITPHPGEAERLLGLGINSEQLDGDSGIQLNRFDVVKDLAKLYSSSVVLKGVGSVICTLDESDSPGIESSKPAQDLYSICSDGNPGMATGGMGDVLSGIAGSLMAQSLNKKTAGNKFANEITFTPALHELVTSAVCLHSAAADLAAKEGQAGLLATDVIESIRFLLK